MDIHARLVSVFKKDAQSYQALNSDNYMDDIKSCLGLARDTAAYDKSLDKYPLDVWEQLLIDKRMSLVVVEEKDSECQPRIIGVCFAFLVDYKFYKYAVSNYSPDASKPRVCTYLLDQHVRPTVWGKSPILTRKGVAQANAIRGENGLFAYYFVWQEEQILEEPQGPHIFSKVLTDAITEIYKGYWLEGIMAEIFSPIAKAHMPVLGYHVNDYEEYYKTTRIPEEQRLFLAHVDRKTIVPGSHLYYLVTIRSPKLKLTRKQREILEFISQGASDTTLAQHYGYKPDQRGIDAIRSSISLIYKKVFATASTQETDSNARLMRAKLIDYLKDHYEECRPYPATRTIPRDQDGKFLHKDQDGKIPE